MNDYNEIGGDLQDEYLALQAAEAAEGNAEAPESAPISPAELDDWYQTWTDENTLDLVPDGETDDGTPIWKFA
jgi:hypothetical protein